MNITLKMNETNVELVISMTMHGARIYRQTFNRDMLKDMNDLYQKLHKNPFEGIDMNGIELNGKTEQEIYDQLVSRVDMGKLIAMREEIHLDYEEMERGSQIIWAFVKNADDKTPDFEKWIDSFEYILPVENIIIALYEAWHKSAVPTVEIKN